jgi:hypothetical protein
MKAPILVPLIERELLLLYITATTQVVSAALDVEREEVGHTLKVQHPIYFISEVLADSKTCYPQIQKLLYVVLIARRKLWYYFESHLVTVVLSFPLGEVSHVIFHLLQILVFIARCVTLVHHLQVDRCRVVGASDGKGTIDVA